MKPERRFAPALRAYLFVSSMLVAGTAGASAGVTYHGRLLTAAGDPVIASGVQFKIQVRSPGNENCLLYEEQQTKDLSSSKGVFALNINDGTATVVNTEPFGLDRVFQNRGTFSFAGGKCAAGSTYAPNPTDGRKLVVEFNDGSFSGWEPMPAQAINFVPMAIESLTVGGFNASSLLRVVDGSGAPAVVSPLTQTQHNTLLDLLNGTGIIAGAQIPAGAVTDAKIDTVSGSKVIGNIAGNAAGFTGALSGDVTGGQSATVVTKIQGRAVDTAVPTNGQALVWNAGNSRWEPGTVSGGGGGDWSTLTGKPATFPSDWSTLANKPATFASDWSTLANKPLTFAPSAHSHPINEISSGTGVYFNYSPNGTACGAGEILKWDTGGGGRWICGVDAGSAGTLASLTVNFPLVKTGTGSDPILSLSDASTSAKGVVQLASSADTTAGLVVQADDTRLSDGRAPTGTAGGELAGSYPNPTVVASVSSSASSLVRRSAGGQIQSASADFGSVGVNNGGGSVVTIQTPAAFTSYTLKLPASAGGNGQILTSNGTDMIWSNASSITASNVSGIVAIANGGTGASTASAARTNLGVTTTGDALVTAADAAAARTAISAMQNVAPGSNGNVLTASGGVWTSAPFTVNAANVGSSVGGYFTYKPNNGTCANGEVLKWETAGGGRWVCGTDISSTGGTGVASVSATAPVTVDNTDPNNPRVEIDDATTTGTGVVQLATSSDTTAGLVVQANDTRLTNSRAPNGSAGGDLSGNYPNPTIAKLQTKDITLTALANGNVLKYDGAKWVNAADSDSLGGLSCTNGDVALYAGGVWSCVAASTTSVNNSVVRRDGAGLITSAGGNFGSLMVNNGTSTITLGTPAAFTSYTLKLPSDAGSNGQILTSNGTEMIWSSASSITAANVSGIVAVANGGTGASTAANARTNLGATATGSSLFTATDATAARAALSALSSTDSRLAPTPAAGNAANYVRVNAGGTAYEARSPANVLSDIGAMANIGVGASGNVLTSNGTTWSSTALPTATTGAKGLMQVGTGLAVSSGTVSVDFGTTSGKVAQGDDPRFPSATCGSGNKMRWDGSTWQCETASATDSTKVAKTGDTMSGSLTLSAGTLTVPANGLAVGTNQLVTSGGKIGVGTASPAYRMDVRGQTRIGTGAFSTNYPLSVQDSDDNAWIEILNSGGADKGAFFGLAVDNFDLWNYQGGHIRFFTSTSASAGTERLRITNDGNVGVGTASPSSKLSVNGVVESSTGGFFSSQTGTGTLQMTAGDLAQSPPAGEASLYVSATTGMLQCRYGASGNCLPTHNIESGFLSSNVTMSTAGTFYGGPTVSLSAGVWQVFGVVTLRTTSTTSAVSFTCKLWDGTTVSSSSEQTSGAVGSAAVRHISMSLQGVVSPSALTTYQISCTSGVASQVFLAAATDYGAGNNASSLWAVRLK